MSCPFTVDGELFKKGGSKSTELDFITATAHRGYSGTAPENTLPAFVLAKKLGYSRVETDVAWTKDDVPVLLHDTTIDRTSDGTGAVLDYTYEELLQFDFGTWKSPDYAGTKIMRFDDFIVMCKKLSIYPHIELKLIESTEHIETLIRIVKRKGMIDNVSWDSFHYDNLVKVKEVYPKASLAYIIDREFTDVMLSNAVSLKTDNNIVMINLFSTYLTETVSNKILDNDLKLCAWSVWSNATVQELAKLGVTNFSVDSLNVAQALYDEFI